MNKDSFTFGWVPDKDLALRLFEGTLSKTTSNVTVNAGGGPVPATVDPSGGFRARANVVAGTNTVTVQATDLYNDQPVSKSFSVTVPSQTSKTPTYDLNGDMTSDGQTKTYQWDAAGRLASIAYTSTSNHSDFTYDGFGRMVKLEEKTGTTVNQTRQFVWDGSAIAEERDGMNAVVRRYFDQGEQIVTGPGAGTLVYYTRDRLGSVREGVDGTGAVRARYDYDPYGIRSSNQISFAALETGTAFIGLPLNSNNEVPLGLYRSYDPLVGVWLSRDPVNEVDGLNLYDYVRNDPINATDPLGLWRVSIGGGATFGGYITFGHNGGKSSFGIGLGGAEGLVIDAQLGDGGSRSHECYSRSTEFGPEVMAKGALGPLYGSIDVAAGIRAIDDRGQVFIRGDASLGMTKSPLSVGGGIEAGGNSKGGCKPSGGYVVPTTTDHGLGPILPHIGAGALLFAGPHLYHEW